jgi:hypothetical protein
MIADLNIERYPWTVVSGASISAVTANETPELTPEGLEIYTTGAAWAGGLIKIVRTLLSQTVTNFQRTLTITPDEGTVLNGQATELDIRLTPQSGLTYPFDLQINWAEGGMIQLATGVQAGTVEWNNTGISVGKPVDRSPVNLNLLFGYNPVAETCSFNYINGAPPPASLQNQPAFSGGWGLNELVYQLQRDLNANGGAMSDFDTNDNIYYLGS